VFPLDDWACFPAFAAESETAKFGGWPNGADRLGGNVDDPRALNGRCAMGCGSSGNCRFSIGVPLDPGGLRCDFFFRLPEICSFWAACRELFVDCAVVFFASVPISTSRGAGSKLDG